MKKCVVVGGGFAGLSAAVYLSKSGYHVELIEASPKLGGRAYSFTEESTGDVIDNGQHIMMGCYRETLNFFSLIGASEDVETQKQLSIHFLKENFRIIPFIAPSSPYPLNLLIALLQFKAIRFAERLNLLKFFLKIYFYDSNTLKKMTVMQWLQQEHQSEKVIKSFWEILTVGALNTSIEKASAKVFSDIVKKIFFRGTKAAAIVLPLSGLSEVYCKRAAIFIENRGGKISVSEKAEEITINDDKVISLKTNLRLIKEFDFVITAVPHYSLKKIGLAELIGERNFTYSTIVSIHLWLTKNPFNEKFYGLIDSPVHWIFNHGSYISLVVSDADYLADTEKKKIFELAIKELEKFTPLKRDEIKHSKIIKEKRATFVSSNDIILQRPVSKTKIKNLFFAGDWTDTGLPSTI
ncbi:MAG: hydroxysqualene dehydroxylase HpnE, partial [Ignavibacteriaceae bacterium]|nr:hydroxysqualene dehydroxylase HpnE [Ignavibacteriaceae bacterium]